MSGASHPSPGNAYSHRHVSLARTPASDCVGGISLHRSHASHATQLSLNRFALSTCSLSVSSSNAAV